jgi:hypothetical protein
MKQTKDTVNYRKGSIKSRCGNCVHFIAKSGSCSKVRGMIEASAMCDTYARKE